MRTYLEFCFNTNPKETRGADCLYFLYLEDAFHSNICRNRTACAFPTAVVLFCVWKEYLMKILHVFSGGIEILEL